MTLAPLLAALLTAAPPSTTYVARFQGDLLWADSLGRIRAWNATTGKPDAAMEQRLHGPSVQQVGGRGDLLFALSSASVLRWTEPGGWKPAFKTPLALPPALALLVVKDRPVLVLPVGVIDLATDKSHALPTGRGRILNLAASGEWIWFGRGMGEWGGEISGLDLTTGTWLQRADDHHYATAFATTADGELVVGWAMSHFGANTIVRAYRAGSIDDPRVVLPKRDSAYVQALALHPDDGQLYAVEQQRIVRIADGALREVTPFTPIDYSKESDAIGAAPGVKELIPISPTTFWVVPLKGEPQFVTVKPPSPKADASR